MPVLDATPSIASSLRFDMETNDYDNGLSAFASVRPRLFGIAYHMLGSAAEAEDIVQDVWLRWQSTNRNRVENPSAFLAKTTARLCINLVQAAHSRRETCVGTWRLEPADSSGDPGSCAERAEALRLAVLVLLEKLSPQNAPHTFCTKRSITRTPRSRISCKWRRQTPANWSPEGVSTLPIVLAHTPVRASSGVF
jgi:hypothetical protein